MTTPHALILGVLENAPALRVYQAIRLLTNKSFLLTLTYVRTDVIRGTVQDGPEKEYRVNIISLSGPSYHTSCQCADALCRGQICVHAVVLAFHTLCTKHPYSWHVGDRVERNGHTGKVICVSGEYVSIQWDTGRIVPVTRDELGA